MEPADHTTPPSASLGCLSVVLESVVPVKWLLCVT